MRTRWFKVLVDLWSNRTRTVIVAMAIAVGVYAVGMVVSTRTLLTREFEHDQSDAMVASAIIRTYPFDDSFADRMAEEPGVLAAEGRLITSGRVYIDDENWREIQLTTIPDFESMAVDRVLPVNGSWPTNSGEVLLERLSLQFIRAQIGDSIEVEFDDGNRQRLTISGTGHDPQKFNPELTNRAFAYVTPKTMADLGFGAQYNELHIRVDQEKPKREYIESIIDQVEEQIKRSGRPILNSTIITESMVETMVDTTVVLLTAFGIVILLLSGFLVVNTISALIAQQLQQIGVMKLIGARRSQIIGMYLLMVLVYGMLAILIGIPLATLSARLLMTELIEDLVNIRPESYILPASIILLQVAIGLLLPLFAGLFPVLNGTRITTRQALSDVGVGGETYHRGIAETVIENLQKITVIQRPLLLAARNTLRHKGRLAQTLIVLIVGTALFISVLTVRGSVNRTLERFLDFHGYDISIGFEEPHRIDQVKELAYEVDGIAEVEGWTVSGAIRQRPDNSESSGFSLVAAPIDSSMLRPVPDAGRWIRSDDHQAIVVNSEFMEDESDVKIGEQLTLEINGRESNWTVVGIVPTDSHGPAVYVSDVDYGYVTRQPGLASHAQIVTVSHDSATQSQLEQTLLQHFESNGLRVQEIQTSQQINGRNQLMFNIIISVLIVMALLLAAVGGLGLTTTMSINVLERIREIGVLRAIGASNGSVRKVVLIEGIAIGLISWIFGLLLSFPVSVFMSDQVGLALLGIPLAYTYAMPAALIWFFGILAVAVAASLGPARDAVRLTIREVLAYE